MFVTPVVISVAVHLDNNVISFEFVKTEHTVDSRVANLVGRGVVVTYHSCGFIIKHIFVRNEFLWEEVFLRLVITSKIII